MDFLPLVIMVVLVLGIVLALVLRDGGGASEPSTNSRPLYDDTGAGYFNTACVIYDYSGMSEGEFDTICALVEAETIKYHRLFDIYNSYSGIVNLHDINLSAGGEAVTVSRELFDFLAFCKSMYALTLGECNIAMGAVLELWHDCREEASYNGGYGETPDEALLSVAMKHTKMSDLVLSEKDSTVKLLDSEMSLDVGAIGKGYAVEKIAERLEGLGLSGIVLDFGGNLKLIGEKPSGKGWNIGIKDPMDTSSYIRKFEFKATSVVTSGDYERYYISGGKRYHHIIDGKTGYPAKGLSSVSVITKNSGLADALSTALFCVGSAQGAMDMLDDIRANIGADIKAVFVSNDGTVTEYNFK